MGLLKRMFGKEEDVNWQTDAQPAPVAPAATPPASTPIVVGNVPVLSLRGDDARDAVQSLEKMTGMDLDGDGKVAGGAAAPPLTSMFSSMASMGQPAAAPDVVSQLERLAALHASGALTDEEFAAEKAKLLAP